MNKPGVSFVIILENVKFFKTNHLNSGLKQYEWNTVLNVGNSISFIEEVNNLFDNPKHAINTLIGIFGHTYNPRNIHHCTHDRQIELCKLEKDKDTFKSDFINDDNDNNFVGIQKINPDHHMKIGSWFGFHIYNDKRDKSFHN